VSRDVPALTDRALRRWSWAAWWFFAAVIAVGAALSLVERAEDPSPVAEELGFGVVLTAFPLTGLLIVRRQLRNTVGWLLLGIGCVWGLGGLGDSYATYGLVIDPGSLPGTDVAATVANGIWAPALGLMGTFLILLFPDGHLPSPGWRPVAWVSAITIVTLTGVLYLSPGRLEEGPGAGQSNPLAVESARPMLEVALAILLPTFAICIAASAGGLVRRFRRSRGVERQQLKWLAAAGAVVATVFLSGIVASTSVSAEVDEPAWLLVWNQVSFLVFALLPVSIGIAVLRHGLYSIDVVINRTLVYGALTATLAAVYLGSVLVLQLALRPLTDQSDLAVAGSTLAVAALFGPARRRTQAIVDRRFYRSRYDAALTLDAFATRLRHQLDLEAVGADLRTAVSETVQPVHVSLWLRSRR